MTTSLVSVVITTFNTAAYLPETLDSVLAQSHPHVETIVVDDGSTDDTVDRARAYGDRITLVERRHEGLGPARNVGLERRVGDFIAFLDSDDVWEPHALATQLAVARACPDSGLIVSDGVEFSGDVVLRPICSGPGCWSASGPRPANASRVGCIRSCSVVRSSPVRGRHSCPGPWPTRSARCAPSQSARPTTSTTSASRGRLRSPSTRRRSSSGATGARACRGDARLARFVESHSPCASTSSSSQRARRNTAPSCAPQWRGTRATCGAGRRTCARPIRRRTRPGRSRDRVPLRALGPGRHRGESCPRPAVASRPTRPPSGVRARGAPGDAPARRSLASGTGSGPTSRASYDATDSPDVEVAMPARVLVIGLDSMDHRLIERWCAEGRLPNIAGVRERAVEFALHNELDALPGSIWVELSTGRSVGHDGRYYVPQQLRTGEAIPRVVQPHDVDTSKDFWTIAGAQREARGRFRHPRTSPAPGTARDPSRGVERPRLQLVDDVGASGARRRSGCAVPRAPGAELRCGARRRRRRVLAFVRALVDGVALAAMSRPG